MYRIIYCVPDVYLKAPRSCHGPSKQAWRRVPRMQTRLSNATVGVYGDFCDRGFSVYYCVLYEDGDAQDVLWAPYDTPDVNKIVAR